MSVDVRVFGGSVPGVVVALECARLGLAVELVTTSLAELPEWSVDAEGGWRWFAETFDLSPLVPVSRPRDVVIGHQGQTVPVPSDSILGIPSSPLSEEVVAAIGQRAASRAYLDRVKPVLTIGKAHRLGALIEKRMGTAVRLTLTDPLVFEHYGVPSADLDVAIAVPGLNEAITRTGSLSTAVLSRLPEYSQREHRFRIEEPTTGSSDTLQRLLSYWNVRVRFVDSAEGMHTEGDAVARAEVFADIGAALRQHSELAEHGLREIAVRDRAEFATDDDVTPVLRRVVAPDGREWSLRVHPARADQPTHVTMQSARVLTELSLAAEMLAPSEDKTSADNTAGDETSADLAVLMACLEEELGGAGTLMTTTTEPAPFVTLEEEHERDGILTAFGENAERKWVGEWLHGGKSSAAIVHARDTATTLRRHLLGLN